MSSLAFVKRPLAALLVAGIVVAGCSQGGAGGAAASQPGGGNATQASGDGGTGDGGTGGKPSGATVRIVNVYAPLNGDPGPIEVYPSSFVLEGSKPLVTVQYGTTSDFFDPTVADDQGHMFLSMYWSGTTGNGTELMSQTETLKGGEVITFVLSTGSNVQDSGRAFGQLGAYFARASGDVFGQETPSAGKGLLIVDTKGVDNVIPSSRDETWNLSTGAGCTRAIGDDAYTLTSVGPGSGTAFELDPGSYTGEIHSIPSGNGQFPDCANAPILGNIPFTIGAGSTTLLLVYAAREGDLRSMVLALDK